MVILELRRQAFVDSDVNVDGSEAWCFFLEGVYVSSTMESRSFLFRLS